MFVSASNMAMRPTREVCYGTCPEELLLIGRNRKYTNEIFRNRSLILSDTFHPFLRFIYSGFRWLLYIHFLLREGRMSPVTSNQLIAKYNGLPNMCLQPWPFSWALPWGLCPDFPPASHRASSWQCKSTDCKRNFFLPSFSPLPVSPICATHLVIAQPPSSYQSLLFSPPRHQF